MRFCITSLFCTILYAELIAIHNVIKIYLAKVYIKIWLEVDALFHINFLTTNKMGNDDIFYLLKDSKPLLSQASYLVTHILREPLLCRLFG